MFEIVKRKAVTSRRSMQAVRYQGEPGNEGSLAGSIGRSGFVVLQVKLVQEAVIDGGENDGHQRQEDDAAEETVERGEEFAAGRLHGIHGAHAGQDHRSVQQCIDERQFAEDMIAPRAQAQRERDQHQSHQEAKQDSGIEDVSGGQGLRFVFEHCAVSPSGEVLLANRRVADESTQETDLAGMDHFVLRGKDEGGEFGLKGGMRFDGRLIELGLGQVVEIQRNLLMDAIEDGTQLVGRRIFARVRFDDRTAAK